MIITLQLSEAEYRRLDNALFKAMRPPLDPTCQAYAEYKNLRGKLNDALADAVDAKVDAELAEKAEQG